MSQHARNRWDPSRRDFLRGISSLLVAPAMGVGRGAAAPLRGDLGIAYTSMVIRMRQARQANRKGPALAAEEYLELCRSFGAEGCQIDIAQLASKESADLKKLRETLEKNAMFLELSMSAKLLEDPDAFASVAATARALGVSCLRMAINGRRYEEFFSRRAWTEFADHWKKALVKAAPMLDQHKIKVGIENHKEWLADELVGMLRQANSPYLGACVDFGNNLALLDDPMELVEALAPHAVTTHLKDMAVSPYEKGFLLSEVPLGTGILPLAAMMERLRRANPDIHFCLEMMTRDPLKVPYRDDSYWASHERRDEGRIARFEAQILSKATTDPLPKVSGLDAAAMLAAEDENIRRCVAYYRKSLSS
ncbi:MAG TPA: TIM barrel protein [Isosphaeraceae bacterium]|nr:TIM barrel protein [Isosphaeraceae bacterium]